MEDFINDFGIFFTAFLSWLTSLWNWYISTIIGKITLGMILILFFAFIIELITSRLRNR